MPFREILFVYGTLRPSVATDEQRPLIEGLERLGEATVTGRLIDLGDYPGLVAGEELVRGELLAVHDPRQLAALDDYEECGGPDPLYRRERTRAHRDDGSSIEVWVYRYARNPPLPPGTDPAAVP
jgi:gamma-glutamylcyclotransferase (GGCT)/AIG2-like uncharacterized protein YtfP